MENITFDLIEILSPEVILMIINKDDYVSIYVLSCINHKYSDYFCSLQRKNISCESMLPYLRDNLLEWFVRGNESFLAFYSFPLLYMGSKNNNGLNYLRKIGYDYSLESDEIKEYHNNNCSFFKAFYNGICFIQDACRIRNSDEEEYYYYNDIDNFGLTLDYYLRMMAEEFHFSIDFNDENVECLHYNQLLIVSVIDYLKEHGEYCEYLTTIKLQAKDKFDNLKRLPIDQPLVDMYDSYSKDDWFYDIFDPDFESLIMKGKDFPDYNIDY